MVKRIGVLTSGGDAPGMNAAIRAVTRVALNSGIEVFGIYDGYKGMVEGYIEPLTKASVGEIVDRGGLVGLNFATIFISDDAHPTFDDLSRHIDRFLERGGEDVLALGSDFDGCDTPEFIRSASDMPSFQELLNSRFGMEITAKLCGENALRFFSNH